MNKVLLSKGNQVGRAATAIPAIPTNAHTICSRFPSGKGRGVLPISDELVVAEAEVEVKVELDVLIAEEEADLLVLVGVGVGLAEVDDDTGLLGAPPEPYSQSPKSVPLPRGAQTSKRPSVRSTFP